MDQKVKDKISDIVKNTLSNKPGIVSLYLFIIWVFFSMLIISYRYI